MQTTLKKYCAVAGLLVAFAAHTQTLTYSNSIVIPGGNPATVVPFDLPQFNPADGTLESVSLAMYSAFQSVFMYNGLSASGELTFMQTNSLSFVYNASDVLAKQNAGGVTFNASLPSHGQSMVLLPPLALQGESTFSDAPDLANFTGPGNIPLNAAYFNLPTVMWTSGTVTWSLDSSATMAAVVTYNFETVPEPDTMTITALGAMVWLFARGRDGQKYFVRVGRE